MTRTTEPRTISPTALDELCKTDEHVQLIDVRTPAEFRAVHATVARNVPLDALDPDAVMGQRDAAGGKRLYLICRSGTRAKQAATSFQKAGYEDVTIVDGGTDAWEKAGLPVARGKKAMSLERQVRIAAGSLVFVGSALTFFVHPYFIAIPAFVGAGLVFAGVTDTCGMAMVLAKMPWNRVKADDPGCCT